MPRPDAPLRLGLVVNPIAGMGGRVALKGTDGAATLRAARARGAVPVAAGRTRRALRRLVTVGGNDIHVLAADGAMGADLAEASGLRVTRVGGPVPRDATTAAHTRRAVAAMRDGGVDLVLFAGGDGTARDVVDALGTGLPLVGVPTGVKMHSGVFAATPDAAGAAAAAYLRAPDPAALRAADVADVDEDAVRAGRVATRLYGSALVPRLPRLIVPAKAAAPAPDAALDALCGELARTLPPDRLTLFGPGTTTARILTLRDLPATLLGVDAVRGGAIVGSDLSEGQLLTLLDAADPAGATLICGVVGGQGSLFGRGNQQLGPRVLRRLGPDGIVVVAAADKLLSLDPPGLRVDTGDDDVDAALSGYVRVHVAPGRTMVMKVST